MNRVSRVASAVAVLALLSSCLEGGQLGGLGAAACPQMRANVDALSANFTGDVRANAKIRTFVQASKDIEATAVAIETTAAEACARIGRDIGIAPQQMAPRQGPGGRAEGACVAVAGAIDSIFRQGIQVRATASMPQCRADVQAEARCQGACQVQVDPGRIVAECEPARLSGRCDGRCVGRCDGTCSGQCVGQCSAYDAAGQCAGQCNGDCNGACNATCHARCEGQWVAPRCEGYVQPPSADAECNASCRAHANVKAQCTPAQVSVQVSQNTELAARLAGSLQANLPALLYAQVALGQRLIADVRVVGQVGAQLPKIIGSAGANAAACIAAGASATARASASINVSVRASASVSGQVGAS